MGMQPLVWRTPGADGGRDIEGFLTTLDASGYVTNEKWYIECKRYAASIDWPTVRGKLAYAENHKADFLLLVTNSNPSPQCETEVSIWNANYHPLKIRVWRGYDLDRIVGSFPSISAKYGLTDKVAVPDSTLVELMSQALRIAQATHATFEFGCDPGPGLEASSALTEMISLRVEQLASHGSVVLAARQITAAPFPWINWPANAGDWDDAGLRALLACLKYCLAAKSLAVASSGEALIIEGVEAKLVINFTSTVLLREVAVWANIQLLDAALGGTRVTIQPAAANRSGN